jgi:hypothetical protein
MIDYGIGVAADAIYEIEGWISIILVRNYDGERAPILVMGNPPGCLLR